MRFSGSKKYRHKQIYIYAYQTTEIEQIEVLDGIEIAAPGDYVVWCRVTSRRYVVPKKLFPLLYESAGK